MVTDNKLQQRCAEIREYCEANSDEKFILKYARFFKHGYHAWGVNPILLKQQAKIWINCWKKDWKLADFIQLGNILIQSGKYEEASFALLFVAAHKKEFTSETFSHIGYWLENGIQNWAHTDGICSELIKPLIVKKIITVTQFEAWRKSHSIWKQRAIPVSLIHAVKNKQDIVPLLQLIEPLMLSQIREVQQGLGWFLREAWKLHSADTELFLLKWKDSCGRIIIQYATEKMNKEEKTIYKKFK